MIVIEPIERQAPYSNQDTTNSTATNVANNEYKVALYLHRVLLNRGLNTTTFHFPSSWPVQAPFKENLSDLRLTAHLVIVLDNHSVIYPFRRHQLLWFSLHH